MEEFIGAAALVGRYVLAFVFLATAVPKMLARKELLANDGFADEPKANRA